MKLHLIYHSIARTAIDQDQINQILRKSREFNRKNDITGCLLFHNHEFLQILEGEAKKVLALFEQIKSDPRHSHVTIMYEQEFTKRIFKGWDMAYENLEDQDMDSITKKLDILCLEGLSISRIGTNNVSALDVFTSISNGILKTPIMLQTM